VARRVVDRQVLHLIQMWLDAPVEEADVRGRTQRTTTNRDSNRGIPQDAPISPLLSNLYMRRLILGWKGLGHEQRYAARIVNYADDMVIRCARNAEEALRHETAVGEPNLRRSDSAYHRRFLCVSGLAKPNAAA